MRLEVSSYVEGGHAVLRAVGEVDLATAGELRAALLELLHAEHPVIVIDASGISFCDSTGLSALLMAARRARSEGRRIALLNPPQLLQKILSVTHVERLLPTYDSIEAATAGETPAG